MARQKPCAACGSESYKKSCAGDAAVNCPMMMLVASIYGYCSKWFRWDRTRGSNVEQIQIWAPWMDSQEFCQLIESVRRKPEYFRKRKADQLGEEINLTYDERQRLRIRTIAPADLTPAEFSEKRRERRREKQRENQRKRRRKAGVKSRTVYLATSLTKLKHGPRSASAEAPGNDAGERDASLKANKLLE